MGSKPKVAHCFFQRASLARIYKDFRENGSTQTCKSTRSPDLSKCGYYVCGFLKNTDRSHYILDEVMANIQNVIETNDHTVLCQVFSNIRAQRCFVEAWLLVWNLFNSRFKLLTLY